MNKLLIVPFVLLLGACASGPDYVRPATELPHGWSEDVTDGRQLADWWLQFSDPVLVEFIDASLVKNHDLRAAAANVEAAAAALRLARADYLPSVNAGMGATRASNSTSAAVPMSSEPYTQYDAGLIVNYEIDLWGRVRRANEAALAELRHDAAVRDGVRAAVTAAVAQVYFETRALDRRIALLERLRATRVEYLSLQQVRLDAGLISPYDFEQSRSETAAIDAQLPLLRSARLHALTGLAVLTGASPQAMYQAWSMQESPSASQLAVLPNAPVVPVDLPSTLLERRPDIRAAEQRLIAANARIGVAKAAYFPQLSLTGFAGGISTAFSTLFDAPARAWEASVALAQPVTDFNRVAANVNAATARRTAAEAAYARTIQAGFKETLDALASVNATRAVMQAQDTRVDALTNAWRVARARYEAGRIGYLEVLDVERQLRDIEQQQVTAQLSLLNSTVDLYRALGGGWQDDGLLAGRD